MAVIIVSSAGTLYFLPKNIRLPYSFPFEITSPFYIYHLSSAAHTSSNPLRYFSLEGVRPTECSVKECLYASMTHSFTSLSALLIAYQYSAGNSSISSHLNTGPSLQTYLEPILQRPHLPIPHFIRSSRVV